MNKALQIFAFYCLISLSACGGGGSGGDSDNISGDNTSDDNSDDGNTLAGTPLPNPDNNGTPVETPSSTPTAEPFSTPTDADSLRVALTTRFESQDDFDFWNCRPSASGLSLLGISLPPANSIGDGHIGLQTDITMGTQITFEWDAISASEIVTTTRPEGVQSRTTDYQFQSESELSFVNSGFTFNCNLDSVLPDGSPSVATPDPEPATMITDGSPLLPAETPTGFTQLWSFSTFQNIGGIFTLGDDQAALFDDGRYTTDVTRVFAEGVDASFAAKPNRWGTYEIRGNDLFLKDSDDTEFDEATRNFSVDGGGINTRLNGCFTKIGGGSLNSPISAISINTFCFDQMGRFTNDRSEFISSSNVVSGGSTETSGQYRIDGYGLRLRYGNGVETNNSFAFLLDDGTSISINTVRLNSTDN